MIKKQQEQDLLKSKNPFAIAVLVCLKILKIRERTRGNKKQEYLDRIEVRKEILELLKDRYDRMNYTEEIIINLVEFVMTILVLPDNMEVAFEKEFYQPYILKHSDMELSIQGRKYANMLGKAHFGNSFDEIVAKWKEALREKEEAFKQKEEERKLREEAFKQKAAAEQQLVIQKEKEQQLKAAAEQQQNQLIINLWLEANFDATTIAKFLNIEVDKVNQVIKNHQQKKDKS